MRQLLIVNIDKAKNSYQICRATLSENIITFVILSGSFHMKLARSVTKGNLQENENPFINTGTRFLFNFKFLNHENPANGLKDLNAFLHFIHCHPGQFIGQKYNERQRG
jgi:hypothetical protein